MCEKATYSLTLFHSVCQCKLFFPKLDLLFLVSVKVTATALMHAYILQYLQSENKNICFLSLKDKSACTNTAGEEGLPAPRHPRGRRREGRRSPPEVSTHNRRETNLQGTHNQPNPVILSVGAMCWILQHSTRHRLGGWQSSLQDGSPAGGAVVDALQPPELGLCC